MNSWQRAAIAAFQNLLVRGLGAAIADVLQKRAVEERNILRHDRHRLMQAVLRHLRDILRADENAPLLDRIEALEQRK